LAGRQFIANHRADGLIEHLPHQGHKADHGVRPETLWQPMVDGVNLNVGLSTLQPRSMSARDL
jgi:hypothetical protein